MGFATYDNPNDPPKPRTPADIGRDIAEHQRSIDDLKAELAGVPPGVLEVWSASAVGLLTAERRVNGTLDLQFRRHDICLSSALYFEAEAVKLRDWLNYYYYPEA